MDLFGFFFLCVFFVGVLRIWFCFGNDISRYNRPPTLLLRRSTTAVSVTGRWSPSLIFAPFVALLFELLLILILLFFCISGGVVSMRGFRVLVWWGCNFCKWVS